MQAADELILECASSPHYAEGLARDARATIRVARGDFDGAREDLEFILEHARRIQDPQRLLPALANPAVVRLSLGTNRAHVSWQPKRSHSHARTSMAQRGDLIFVAGQFGLRDAYRQSVESARGAHGRNCLSRERPAISSVRMISMHRSGAPLSKV